MTPVVAIATLCDEVKPAVVVIYEVMMRLTPVGAIATLCDEVTPADFVIYEMMRVDASCRHSYFM